MDRWYENNGGDCAAVEECLAQATSLSSEVVDDDGTTTLLMELMEDDYLPPPSDPIDDDGEVVGRLSHVIRSLEAEISAATTAVMVDDDGSTAAARPSSEEHDDGEIRLVDDEDMSLLDLGGYDDSGSSLGYCWPPEVPMLAGHAAEGWYVYAAADECEGGIVGYEPTMDHQYHQVESSADQQVLYSPLWE